MRKNKTNFFTMIETIIALGVLILTLAVLFSMIAASQKRIIKAEQKWQRQHMLTQAAEYFMLAPPGSAIPQIIFPFNNYQVFCEYSDPENLPESVEIQNNNWRLAAMKIIIKSNQSGKTFSSITLDRIIKADE